MKLPKLCKMHDADNVSIDSIKYIILLQDPQAESALKNERVSLLNGDYTAKQLLPLIRNVGINLESILLWNLFPWYSPYFLRHTENNQLVLDCMDRCELAKGRKIALNVLKKLLPVFIEKFDVKNKHCLILAKSVYEQGKLDTVFSEPDFSEDNFWVYYHPSAYKYYINDEVATWMRKRLD